MTPSLGNFLGTANAEFELNMAVLWEGDHPPSDQHNAHLGCCLAQEQYNRNSVPIMMKIARGIFFVPLGYR